MAARVEVAQPWASSPPADDTSPWLAPPDDPDLALGLAWNAAEPSGAAWPVILLHVALTLLVTGMSLGITHYGLRYDLLTCAVIAFCTFSVTFGPLGLLLSWAAGSTALGANLAWGCGLVAATLCFFAGCGVLGVLAAVVAQMVLGPVY